MHPSTIKRKRLTINNQALNIALHTMRFRTPTIFTFHQIPRKQGLERITFRRATNTSKTKTTTKKCKNTHPQHELEKSTVFTKREKVAIFREQHLSFQQGTEHLPLHAEVYSKAQKLSQFSSRKDNNSVTNWIRTGIINREIAWNQIIIQCWNLKPLQKKWSTRNKPISLVSQQSLVSIKTEPFESSSQHITQLSVHLLTSSNFPKHNWEISLQ